MIKVMNKARYFLISVGRADTVFYLLPPLMLLLVIGTVAQRPMGLYAAQKMFFSSFVFWYGPLPLPGGYTIVGLIALSLAVKFLFQSEWSWRKAGINVTHFGILVLLFGGLLTAMKARESFMVIPEGTQSEYLYDYHQRELYIFQDDLLIRTIPFHKLGLRITGLPFDLSVMNTCDNCSIVKRGETGNFRDMAQFMALHDLPVSKDPEADLPGLTFQIRGLKDQEGTYIAFEGMPKPVVLNTGDHKYKIIFGKQQSILPFAVRLDDFTRDVYPGTNKARGYSSDVIIIDNGVEWPAHIAMNAPLRYKGYTFYQSSFEESEGMSATILSVVENHGRLFPYIGTILVAAGLLLHIALVLKGKTA